MPVPLYDALPSPEVVGAALICGVLLLALVITMTRRSR
jgi:hypothetical protein